MIRSEMIRVIAHFAEKNGPFDDPKYWDKEDRILEWIAQAPEGWFDVMTDIIANPPDWVLYEKEHGLWLEEGWQEFVFSYLIGEGISENLEHRLPQISPLLSRADTRLLILWAYAWTNTTLDMVAWLRPLVEQVSILMEDEQIALAVAVGHIQLEESLQMLLTMRTAIPVTATKVHQYINSYLPPPYFQPSLSTNINGNL